ncbi:MAG: type restriction enzyme subunit [Verrucomicrobiota bacterium]
MPNFISEDQIERALVQKLQHLHGFDSLDCHTGDPEDLNDGSGRTNKRDVILEDRVREAAVRLNPSIPAKAIDDALERLLDRRQAMSLVAANQEVYNLLRDGIPVEFDNAKGQKQQERVRLTACLLAQAYQSLWLVELYDACEHLFSFNHVIQLYCSPGLRLPGLLHCPEGFRPGNASRRAPASVEYLWRNTGLNQELFMLSSAVYSFMSRSRVTSRVVFLESPILLGPHGFTGHRHGTPPLPLSKHFVANFVSPTLDFGLWTLDCPLSIRPVYVAPSPGFFCLHLSDSPFPTVNYSQLRLTTPKLTSKML